MGGFSGGGKGGGGGDIGMPTMPNAPDPTQTAKNQQAFETTSALTNAVLQNPAIYSPYGNVTYDTNGYSSGPGNYTPRAQQYITLSPSEQAIFDSSQAARQSIANRAQGIAGDISRTGSSISLAGLPDRPTNIDFSKVSATPGVNDFDSQRKAVEDAIYNRSLRLMQPEMDRQQKAIEERLAQTGNPMGSQYYTGEMDRYQRDKNESLANLADQAVISGGAEDSRLFGKAAQTQQMQIADALRGYQTASMIRNDSISEQQALRNQQINELSAMLQGKGAINLPASTTQYNQQPMAAPDYLGLTGDIYKTQSGMYNNQLNAYGQQQAQQNQLQAQSANGFTSGLFSLGSQLMGGLFG
jgi:hypothetical protein